MFDFTKLIGAITNVTEGARCVDAADSLQPDTPMLNFPTTQGPMNEILRIPYAAGQGVAVRVWRGVADPVVVAAFSGLSFQNDALGFLAGAGFLGDSQGVAGKVNRMAARWANRCYVP